MKISGLIKDSFLNFYKCTSLEQMSRRSMSSCIHTHMFYEFLKQILLTTFLRLIFYPHVEHSRNSRPSDRTQTEISEMLWNVLQTMNRLRGIDIRVNIIQYHSY